MSRLARHMKRANQSQKIKNQKTALIDEPEYRRALIQLRIDGQTQR